MQLLFGAKNDIRVESFIDDPDIRYAIQQIMYVNPSNIYRMKPGCKQWLKRYFVADIKINLSKLTIFMTQQRKAAMNKIINFTLS